MKAPVSTALSMAAILATGGAALAVNATVLDPQDQSGSPATSAPAPEASTPSTQPAADGVTNEFQIPGVALVTMITVRGQLTLHSVVPYEGITYSITKSSPGEFEIRFESPAQVVQFMIRLVGDEIVTSATSTSTSTNSQAPSTPAPANATTTGSSTPPVNNPTTGGGTSYSGHGDDDDHEDGEFEYEGEEDD